jgi:hypothetical protein
LGNDAGSGNYLQKSLALSRRQGALRLAAARSHQPWSHLQRTGRTNEARGLLAPLVRNTRGMSTGDLISARRILETMN